MNNATHEQIFGTTANHCPTWCTVDHAAEGPRSWHAGDPLDLTDELYAHLYADDSSIPVLRLTYEDGLAHPVDLPMAHAEALFDALAAGVVDVDELRNVLTSADAEAEFDELGAGR